MDKAILPERHKTLSIAVMRLGSQTVQLSMKALR